LINNTIEKVYTAIVPTVLNVQRSEQKSRNETIKRTTAKAKQQAEHFNSDDCTTLNQANIYNNHDFKISNTRHSLPSESASHDNDKNATILRKNTLLEHNERSLINSTTMSNIQDREIIVINQSDIEESTNKEKVIVINNVQKKENVDLADLLGTNWPINAGGAAVILNGKSSDNKLEKQASTSTHASFAKNKELADRKIPPTESKSTGNTGKRNCKSHTEISLIIVYQNIALTHIHIIH